MNKTIIVEWTRLSGIGKPANCWVLKPLCKYNHVFANIDKTVSGKFFAYFNANEEIGEYDTLQEAQEDVEKFLGASDW